MNPHRPTAGSGIHRIARLLIAITTAFTLAMLLVCTAAPSDPTPDIQATVAAGIAATKESDKSIEATITARTEQTKHTEQKSTTEPTPDIAGTITARLQAHREVSPGIAATKEPNRSVVIVHTVRVEQNKHSEPKSTTEPTTDVAAKITARLQVGLYAF